MKKSIILLLFIACVSGRIASAQTISGEAPRFRVAVQGGYGYRLGKIQESGQNVIDQHNKKLKWGVVYGADATWFVANDFGFGLKFNNLRSKAEDAVTITYDDSLALWHQLALLPQAADGSSWLTVALDIYH